MSEEQGLQGFNTESWNALMAPKGTPKDIIDRLKLGIHCYRLFPPRRKSASPNSMQ